MSELFPFPKNSPASTSESGTRRIRPTTPKRTSENLDDTRVASRQALQESFSANRPGIINADHIATAYDNADRDQTRLMPPPFPKIPARPKETDKRLPAMPASVNDALYEHQRELEDRRKTLELHDRVLRRLNLPTKRQVADSVRRQMENETMRLAALAEHEQEQTRIRAIQETLRGEHVGPQDIDKKIADIYRQRIQARADRSAAETENGLLSDEYLKNYMVGDDNEAALEQRLYPGDVQEQDIDPLTGEEIDDLSDFAQRELSDDDTKNLRSNKAA